jgi:hypothetical protein
MRKVAVLGFVLAAGLACGCSSAPDGLMLAGMAGKDRSTPAASRSAMDAAGHGTGTERPVFPIDLAAVPRSAEDGAEVRTDAGDENPFVLALEQAAKGAARPADTQPAAGAATTAPTTAPAEANLPYVPWQHRQGPAYPGNFWWSFGRYGKELCPTLWDDAVATATNPWAIAGIVAAGASGIAINATGVDDTVANHYTVHHPQLNKFWDVVGDAGGNPGTHFAITGAMYFASLAANDKVNYEKATTMMNALIISDLFVVFLKGVTNTRSPNGDPWGWPSGHTSSSFTFATVILEEYGPWAGVPAMAFATFVGYERIDARNHDFSDVISGALIGIAVGHAVAQNHMPRIMGFDVVPYVDPASGAVGVSASKRW